MRRISCKCHPGRTCSKTESKGDLRVGKGIGPQRRFSARRRELGLCIGSKLWASSSYRAFPLLESFRRARTLMWSAAQSEGVFADLSRGGCGLPGRLLGLPLTACWGEALCVSDFVLKCYANGVWQAGPQGGCSRRAQVLGRSDVGTDSGLDREPAAAGETASAQEGGSAARPAASSRGPDRRERNGVLKPVGPSLAVSLLFWVAVTGLCVGGAARCLQLWQASWQIGSPILARTYLLLAIPLGSLGLAGAAGLLVLWRLREALRNSGFDDLVRAGSLGDAADAARWSLSAVRFGRFALDVNVAVAFCAVLLGPITGGWLAGIGGLAAGLAGAAVWAAAASRCLVLLLSDEGGAG